MKNLFDLATKELSQDAILRWIFENWDDNDIKDLVNDLLKEFCKFSDEKIDKIVTSSQWKHTDVSILIITNIRKVVLFIEDKTFTQEHNQLDSYNQHIQKCENEEYDVYKVFYKTSTIDDDEIKRVESAGWKIYDIEKIYYLFKKYLNSSNLILKQYAEYLKKLFEASRNEEKPTSNEGNIDILKWKSFFKKNLFLY